MFKFLLFALLFCMPYFVFAQEYKDEAGIGQMLADEIGDYWTYIFDDVPTLWQRFVAWFLEMLIYIKYLLLKQSILFSWGVAKVIIADLNIMSEITANMSLLPQDVKQALVDMRLFDGVNLILHAFMTRFVMRLF